MVEQHISLRDAVTAAAGEIRRTSDPAPVLQKLLTRISPADLLLLAEEGLSVRALDLEGETPPNGEPVRLTLLKGGIA
jgi:hypothetical protein